MTRNDTKRNKNTLDLLRLIHWRNLYCIRILCPPIFEAGRTRTAWQFENPKPWWSRFGANLLLHNSKSISNFYYFPQSNSLYFSAFRSVSFLRGFRGGFECNDISIQFHPLFSTSSRTVPRRCRAVAPFRFLPLRPGRSNSECESAGREKGRENHPPPLTTVPLSTHGTRSSQSTFANFLFPPNAVLY